MNVARTVVIGASSLALVGGLGVASASAAPTASPRSGDQATATSAPTNATTLTVLPSTDPTPKPEKLALLAPQITCDLNVQNPHGSTHVQGTINVVSVVTCKGGNAARIEIQTELWRISTQGRWVGAATIVENKSSAQGNAATSCSAGPAQFRG